MGLHSAGLVIGPSFFDASQILRRGRGKKVLQKGLSFLEKGDVRAEIALAWETSDYG